MSAYLEVLLSPDIALHVLPLMAKAPLRRSGTHIPARHRPMAARPLAFPCNVTQQSCRANTGADTDIPGGLSP